MKIEHKQMNLEIKALNATGEFEGYASVFNVVDAGGDIVMPGAFAKSLADWKAKGALPPILWCHDSDEPIGEHLELVEDERGLRMKGKLWMDEPRVDEAVKAYRGMKAKNVTGISIGYVARDYSIVDGVRMLKEIELWENSILPFPMNDLARVEAVKAAFAKGEVPDKRTLEAALRDVGLSAKSAKALLSGGYAALNERDADSEAETKTILEKITALESKMRS